MTDLISAAEQGLIAMSPAELLRLKSAATEPVRHSLTAASAGGVRGSRPVPSRIIGGTTEPPRERFEVTVQTAKSSGVPYLGVRLHLVLNNRQLRPAYVSALGVQYILKHADELRAAIDVADKQLSAYAFSVRSRSTPAVLSGAAGVYLFSVPGSRPRGCLLPARQPVR